MAVLKFKKNKFLWPQNSYSFFWRGGGGWGGGDDVDIGKVLVSKKISFGEKNYKYFIGYLYDNYKVKPLYIMLPKTTAFVKSYDRRT